MLSLLIYSGFDHGYRGEKLGGEHATLHSKGMLHLKAYEAMP